MAKIQLLAVLSLDGSIWDIKTEGKQSAWLAASEIEKFKEDAAFEIPLGYPLSMLFSAREDSTKSVYLVEATEESANYINSILRVRAIDEMVIYVVPQIADTENRLFLNNLPVSSWDLAEHKAYKNGVVRNIYRQTLENK